MQMSSSCHYYIITGLTAKFQMLIRQARVKLCDFEKQEVLFWVCLCQTTQNFRIATSILELRESEAAFNGERCSQGFKDSGVFRA